MPRLTNPIKKVKKTLRRSNVVNEDYKNFLLELKNAPLEEQSKDYLKNLAEQARSHRESIYALRLVLCFSSLLKDSMAEANGNEFLKGAHLKIQRAKNLFDAIKKRTDHEKSFSSHYWGLKKEEIRINIQNSRKEILVGFLPETNELYIQVEKTKVRFNLKTLVFHPLETIICIVLHTRDFLHYKWTGNNVGWTGLSEITEKKANEFFQEIKIETIAVFDKLVEKCKGLYDDTSDLIKEAKARHF